MSLIEEFLSDWKRRHWSAASGMPGVDAIGYYLPTSATSVEVALAQSATRPTKEDARRLWRARHNNRAVGVLLVVGYPSADGDQAAIVGLQDDSSVAYVTLSRVEECVERALEAHADAEARELLQSLFDQPDDGMPSGLRNKGLFASHALVENAPRRADWPTAGASARATRGTRGEDLLRALGWSITPTGSDLLLRPQGRERDAAVAVLLEGDEVFDRPALRYGLGVSPVEHGLEVARHHELPWVLAVRGSTVRLYASNPDKGVTRTGAASYTELTLDLLADDGLAYVWLLLTPEALREDGTAEEILRDSREHATGLGERLRDRIYVDVVPGLAETVASKLGDLSPRGLESAYHHTLVVLFRLLFVAYAEDRALLPYGLGTPKSTMYTRLALKTRAKIYAEESAATGGITFDERSTDVWDDLRAIWHGIYHGHTGWGVPEYGGALFRDDTPSGAAIAELTLTNAEIEPALVALLVDTGRDGTRGPVDFQALSVREFGTIYEGLLESSLSLASQDLTLADQTIKGQRLKVYIPAKPGDSVAVLAGSVYFHNSSGARKATGSYFTKEFAVEHLLETALDPTLDEHLERVRKLLEADREGDAAEAFFDFRVADIAMGSGHFLVAAVDHLAAGMSGFLDRHPVPRIQAELTEIRTAAIDKLREVGITGPAAPEVTHEALLRRQVARRCIYGVDVNEIAVDLAPLALWIHTFVPGLPMSSLDHGLVHGNSLTGIGTVGEALDALEPERVGAYRGARSLFADAIEDAIAATAEPLARAARISELSVAETQEAERLTQEAATAVEPVKLAFDAIVAARAGVETFDLRLAVAQGWDRLVQTGTRLDVREMVDPLEPVHFPVAFPEAFRPGRERPGFDVILGNPPWEKVHVEKHQWWGLRLPGIRSEPTAKVDAAIEALQHARPDLVAEYEYDITTNEAMRQTLKAGPFPGIGNGHIDLYKVFCWRDWVLLRDGGRAGVVFPRGALSGSGTAAWRENILAHGAFDDVCFLTNTKNWVFGEVHPQYTVALTTIRRGGSNTVTFNGPFHSRNEFEAGRRVTLSVEATEFVGWAAGAAFPLLPNNDSASVFRQMRSYPRFDSTSRFAFRPVQGDLNATSDKSLLDFDLSETDDCTPVLAGKSFNLWEPDFGAPYATADPRDLEDHLQRKRHRQVRTSSSAFHGMDDSDPATLPLHRARIAFRDVARATDTRTVIAALLPPGVSLVHNAPHLLRRRGGADEEALLLALLSSIPFDWYARRYVELHLTFDVLASLPTPQPVPGSIVSRRTIEIAGRLAAVDERYTEWAAEVGVPVGSANDPTVKNDLIAELDAVVSHLYGLSREQVQIIFETFHRGWDYAPRLAAVLAHYDRWATLSEDANA